MRTCISHLLLLPVLISGCVLLDDGLTGSRMRADCERGRETPPGHRQGTDSLPDPPSVADTVCYFTAVRFPEDYDWQRDTAYGTASFELLLYRDLQPVLTLKSGPGVPFSPDPDRHHILSGHLYSERMLGGETLIGRDGEEVIRFAGREYLLGLLEADDGLYTLSGPASGNGFRLRKDGQILLGLTDGTPYGSLSDPSYAPSGALYRDNGQICFCYWEGNAVRRSHYLVRDGQQTPVSNILPTQTVLDIKLQDGRVRTLFQSFPGSRMSEGRIWPEETGYAVTGRFLDGTGGQFSGFLDAGFQTGQHRLCEEDAAIYHTPEATFAVSADPDGTVRWYGPESGGRSGTPCYFFSPACATAAGRTLCLALTPKDTSRPPQIRIGGQVEEVDLYGYISRVAVEVIPRPN